MKTTPRLVRFSVTDCDATDSSSDDESEGTTTNLRRRVQRHVSEVKLETNYYYRAFPDNGGGGGIKKKRRRKTQLRPVAAPPSEKNFRVVRRRPWGKWAALVYDTAVIGFHGRDSKTNLLTPPKDPREFWGGPSADVAADSDVENIQNLRMFESGDEFVTPLMGDNERYFDFDYFSLGSSSSPLITHHAVAEAATILPSEEDDAFITESSLSLLSWGEIDEFLQDQCFIS